MATRHKKIVLGSKIRHRNGSDYTVESIPYFYKYYCRTADDKKEFKVIFDSDVEFVHSSQPQLDFVT